VFSGMDCAGNLNEHERAFFIDERLSDFWGSVAQYLDQVGYERADNAASQLVGSFLGGLDLYGHSGTKDRPSRKTKVRERQQKADALIAKAAQLSEQLTEVLEQIEKTTHIIPDEMYFMALFRKVAVDVDGSFERTPSHWEDIRAWQVTGRLGESLRSYPKTDEQFAGVPGMASRESSWRDWMRSAHDALQHCLRMCPGSLVVKEKHWVVLAKVLIDEGISRDRVHPVFTQLNNGTT